MACEIRVPLPGDLDPLDQLPHRLLVSDQALVLEILHVRRPPRVQPFSRVRLKLDGVGARRRGSLDEAKRRGEVAIVVGAGLGDDVAGVIAADRARTDQELSVAVDPCAHD